jgi:hypothetical protein
MAAKECKFGKFKSGARKGMCRKTKATKRKLFGAAHYAKQCKGNKGSAFKACMRHALNGMRRMGL